VGLSELVPVGTFPKDKARWGHFDLGGNAFEWALDLFESFDYSTICLDCARTTMTALGGMSRIVRGAGIGFAPFPTSGQGGFRPPTDRDYKVGARCAHDF
jgi:formylglycine-generating enzyme required for sulfatase activity